MQMIDMPLDTITNFFRDILRPYRKKRRKRMAINAAINQSIDTVVSDGDLTKDEQPQEKTELKNLKLCEVKSYTTSKTDVNDIVQAEDSSSLFGDDIGPSDSVSFSSNNEFEMDASAECEKDREGDRVASNSYSESSEIEDSCASSSKVQDNTVAKNNRKYSSYEDCIEELYLKELPEKKKTTQENAYKKNCFENNNKSYDKGAISIEENESCMNEVHANKNQAIKEPRATKIQKQEETTYARKQNSIRSPETSDDESDMTFDAKEYINLAGISIQKLGTKHKNTQSIARETKNNDIETYKYLYAEDFAALTENNEKSNKGRSNASNLQKDNESSFTDIYKKNNLDSFEINRNISLRMAEYLSKNVNTTRMQL